MNESIATENHTPGPWSTGGIFGPGTPNAMTWIWGPRTQPDHQSGPIVATDVRLKDAYLIAAAPDLLAALKSCVDVLMVGATGERDRALAAIAKAEVRS